MCKGSTAKSDKDNRKQIFHFPYFGKYCAVRPEEDVLSQALLPQHHAPCIDLAAASEHPDGIDATALRSGAKPHYDDQVYKPCW